jgi:NADH-quinone oxidoreductase subunit L
MLTAIVSDVNIWSTLLATNLPLVAFAFIMIFFRPYPKLSAFISIGSIAIGFVCSIYLLIANWHMVDPIEFSVRWMMSGKIIIPVGLLLDPLSLIMLLIASSIALLVQIYSLGYMDQDPGFSRYFAYMSLFAWSMGCLVVAPNVLQLYIFWELVGLSSYLLIGFWVEKFSATRAGKKAFIMTRIGDVAFFLGILLLLMHAGTLNIVDLNTGLPVQALPPHLLTLSILLIFGGIIGKSAQFPLMTWLPDAMEGPTPVSALLHSATMVAAGVYLFARLFPLFSLSETAQTFTLAIATISMLMSATMAMVSRDIKKVWAYSSISQLGFMIMGLGAGSYTAGVFHLATHAGFKALLFLCAGVFIHQFDTNDMFDIGQKGGRSLKIPAIALVIAGAALTGIWPLSGFYSKEMIIAQLISLSNPVWAVSAFIGVFLTAYYTFRLLFIILFPKANLTKDTAHHSPKWAYLFMVIPLVVLALITLVLGFTEKSFVLFLEGTTMNVSHAPSWLAPFSMGLVALAIGLAWWEFGKKQAKQIGFIEKFPAVYRFFNQRWYLDKFYEWIYRHILVNGLADLCKRIDLNIINGFIRLLSQMVINSGKAMASVHQIQLQMKLMIIFGFAFGFTVLMMILG